MDRATARSLAIAQYHFARMWAARHEASGQRFATGEAYGPAERREGLRANLRAQRGWRAA